MCIKIIKKKKTCCWSRVKTLRSDETTLDMRLKDKHSKTFVSLHTLSFDTAEGEKHCFNISGRDSRWVDINFHLISTLTGRDKHRMFHTGSFVSHSSVQGKRERFPFFHLVTFGYEVVFLHALQSHAGFLTHNEAGRHKSTNSLFESSKKNH